MGEVPCVGPLDGIMKLERWVHFFIGEELKNAPNMGIETLTGANHSSWKDSLMLTLGMLDFDLALTEDAPPALTDKSTPEEKIAHEKWQRSNKMSLMLMKNSISPIIRGGIPDSPNAKTYLASVEEQFQGTFKAHASTLILKLVTTKYDGRSGIREHILMMNDMARKLKGLDMEISDGFLVHFIMTSLPSTFEAFKVNYNTQKEKWSMSELITMTVQEEERLKLEKPDVAYLVAADSKKRKGKFHKKEGNKAPKTNASALSSSNNSDKKSYCRFCRKVGHKQSECSRFKEWLAKKGISSGSKDSKEITTNKQVCKLCEDFTSRVVQYFSANETQTDIIRILHQACSHMHGFKHQCDLLVDHYAPLFFVKIATLQPELVCEKVNLCGEMVSIRLPKRDNTCTICHRLVAEVLTKLEDPDTQLEIIETLLKECSKVETFAQQCKKLVFEYGPIILANAEKFLQTTDICVATHVCRPGPGRQAPSLGLQSNVASA